MMNRLLNDSPLYLYLFFGIQQSRYTSILYIFFKTKIILTLTCIHSQKYSYIHFCEFNSNQQMWHIAISFFSSFFQTYKFPLSIVVCHLVFKFIVALICRKIYEIRNHQKRVLLCWHNQLHKIAPTGIASGLDIGFSQWGLQLNAVSL